MRIGNTLKQIEDVGFSATDDLPANQAGTLSALQIAALRTMQRHAATSGFLSALITGFISLLFAQFAPFITDAAGVVILVIVFSLPPIGLTLFEYIRLQQDIHAGVVKKIDGKIDLEQRGFLKIGERDLRVSREEVQQLQPHLEDTIRIFYIPRSKLIVGAYLL